MIMGLANIGKLLFLAVCILSIRNSFVNGEQFDVLKISNVPFPSVPWGTDEGKSKGIIDINATYIEAIPDYTICYRILIDHYNDGLIIVFHALKI